MELRRARVELDYDHMKIMCHHYSNEIDEPTIVEIDGREYPGIINVKQKDYSYIIKIDICK